MEPCPKCGWQNQDNAQKCANCFQVLRGGGSQPMNQSPAGQMQQPRPMQGQQPYGAPGGVQAPPGPAYPGQQRPVMQYYEYMGFWPRVGASLIDGILLLIVAFGLIFATVGVPDPAALQNPMMMQEWMVKVRGVQFLGWLVSIIYDVGLTTACGGTLGKLALGMKVVKTDGSPVGFGVALGRYFLKFIIGFVPCGFLSYITVATNPVHQGWYDRLMNTMVVKK